MPEGTVMLSLLALFAKDSHTTDPPWVICQSVLAWVSLPPLTLNALVVSVGVSVTLDGVPATVSVGFWT